MPEVTEKLRRKSFVNDDFCLIVLWGANYLSLCSRAVNRYMYTVVCAERRKHHGRDGGFGGVTSTSHSDCAWYVSLVLSCFLSCSRIWSTFGSWRLLTTDHWLWTCQQSWVQSAGSAGGVEMNVDAYLFLFMEGLWLSFTKIGGLPTQITSICWQTPKLLKHWLPRLAKQQKFEIVCECVYLLICMELVSITVVNLKEWNCLKNDSIPENCRFYGFGSFFC